MKSGSTAVSTVDLQRWVATLPALVSDGDTDRVEQLTLLERLKSVCAAVQARVTVELADSLHADAAARNLDKDRTERSIAAQIALARRESPVAGRRHLGLARALAGPLSRTAEALQSGQVSEWRATLVHRATSHLTDEQRATVDAEIAAQLPRSGDRRLHDTATAIGYRLDPEGALRRSRKAVSERRVSVRPAPDSMAYLTALLPMAQAVAVFAALHHDATAINLADGDRTKPQIMADELVSRCTRRAFQGCDTDGVPARMDAAIKVNLVMTDQTLLGSSDESAVLDGHGPIPADLARRLVTATDKAWIRRLYASPDSCELIAMDSKSRLFPEAMRTLIRLRDQTCRTPWCDAPIKHTDHVQQHHRGGPTSLINGQGLCENCNQTKEAGAWVHRRQPNGDIRITTPLRIDYTSPPRQAPGSPRGGQSERVRR